MVLNFQVETKQNKNKSKLYKSVLMTNGDKNISYKTIRKMYDRLIDEGYEKEKIYVRVLNPQREFTLKGLDEDFENTLDEYYKNKVANPAKFTNEFYRVQFGILE
jgi:hypothetical protein